jgi:hypothetical protein
MRKILVIDYLTRNNFHTEFNILFIQKLIKDSTKPVLIDLICKSSKNEIQLLENNSRVKYLGEKYISSKENRFFLTTTILSLNFLNFKKYNQIYFLCYDNSSISFFRKRKDVYLVNHNNLSHLKTTFLEKLFYYLTSRFNHIVLTKDSSIFLSAIGFKKIIVHPHPVPKLPNVKSFFNNKFLEEIRVQGSSNIISILANVNLDISICNEIILSKAFSDFLKINNLLLLHRVKQYNVNLDCIVGIQDYLDTNDYNKLILESKIILFLYDENYKYRVSSILLEAISAKKHVLIFDYPGVLKEIDYDKVHYFNNLLQLKRIIKKICAEY